MAVMITAAAIKTIDILITNSPVSASYGWRQSGSRPAACRLAVHAIIAPLEA